MSGSKRGSQKNVCRYVSIFLAREFLDATNFPYINVSIMNELLQRSYKVFDTFSGKLLAITVVLMTHRNCILLKERNKN